MEKLLASRRQRDEVTQKLNNLSPQKYGKGAYCGLTFTPSKLADNVIFRQASNLKRIEEETSKGRQYEAQNQVLSDQVTYLKKERDGISDSLNQIIDMYKKIISEMETKNQARIRDIQKKFTEQIQRNIRDKEEEAKFFQSEKEIYEDRINELESQIQNLKDELAETNSNKNDCENILDKLRIEHKHLQQRLEDTEKKAQANDKSHQQEFDNLKKDFLMAEVNWKNTMNEENHKKEKERESLERTHRAQLQKIESQRNNENVLKNQEINEITQAFNSESKKLNDIVSNKEKSIENLTAQNNKEKTRILNLTRDYQTEINHLTHEKNRLFDELDHLGKQNEVLARDKALITGELQNQNINLRELLMESSVELEKCKNEFISLAKQNTQLLVRLKVTEDEGRTWRDSYYLNRTRS